MSVPIEELKNRLTKALSINNIRPIELSEKTNIPKSSISQYMSGYTKPNSERVYLISRALNVSEAWLMGFDVPMERETESFIEYSNDEKVDKLIKTFEQLSDVGKEKVIEYANDLLESPKYVNNEIYSSEQKFEETNDTRLAAAPNSSVKINLNKDEKLSPKQN